MNKDAEKIEEDFREALRKSPLDWVGLARMIHTAKDEKVREIRRACLSKVKSLLLIERVTAVLKDPEFLANPYFYPSKEKRTNNLDDEYIPF